MLSNWDEKKQNSQKHRRVICATYGVVFSLCSTVKSWAGVLCLILVVSRQMWVIGIKEESETKGIWKIWPLRKDRWNLVWYHENTQSSLKKYERLLQNQYNPGSSVSTVVLNYNKKEKNQTALGQITEESLGV